MNLYNYFSEKFVLPTSDIFFGRNISRSLKFLSKSQWWTEDELISFQNERLNLLINHAFNNVPFYSELFKSLRLGPQDIKCIDDLKKLPILTKDQIRKNFPQKIVAKNLSPNDYYISSSSGSTGEPLQYYRSKFSYGMNIACNLRGWYWMGFRLGDKFVKLSQNPRNKFEKQFQDRINRNKYLSVQQLNEENIAEIVVSLLKYEPTIIRGYSDPMLFLANYCRKNNINNIFPKSINTTGNVLFPEARKIIENQFDCKVFDSYTCEGSAAAFECLKHECYHLSDEYAISELIAMDEQVSEGERGQLVTTDLWNFAMPFIRYNTQDVLVKSNKKCTCGRNLLAIEKIEGRDCDILITPRGKLLILHNFTVFFADYISILQFQVNQIELNKIIIRLVVSNGFDQNTKESILNKLNNYIDDEVILTIEIVNNIELGPSGKRRFLIRNKKIPLNL